VKRDDTLLRPFKIIPGASSIHLFFLVCMSEGLKIHCLSGGVHHWDENGVEDGSQEPEEIRLIHAEMIEFVKVWLEEWSGTPKGAPAVVQ
jgi:hypothetical protein